MNRKNPALVHVDSFEEYLQLIEDVKNGKDVVAKTLEDREDEITEEQINKAIIGTSEAMRELKEQFSVDDSDDEGDEGTEMGMKDSKERAKKFFAKELLGALNTVAAASNASSEELNDGMRDILRAIQEADRRQLLSQMAFVNPATLKSISNVMNNPKIKASYLRDLQNIANAFIPPSGKLPPPPTGKLPPPPAGNLPPPPSNLLPPPPAASNLPPPPAASNLPPPPAGNLPPPPPPKTGNLPPPPPPFGNNQPPPPPPPRGNNQPPPRPLSQLEQEILNAKLRKAPPMVPAENKSTGNPLIDEMKKGVKLKKAPARVAPAPLDTPSNRLKTAVTNEVFGLKGVDLLRVKKLLPSFVDAKSKADAISMIEQYRSPLKNVKPAQRTKDEQNLFTNLGRILGKVRKSKDSLQVDDDIAGLFVKRQLDQEPPDTIKKYKPSSSGRPDVVESFKAPKRPGKARRLLDDPDVDGEGVKTVMIDSSSVPKMKKRLSLLMGSFGAGNKAEQIVAEASEIAKILFEKKKLPKSKYKKILEILIK